MSEALITCARKIFHRNILDTNTLILSGNGTASNADSSSSLSRYIALRTAEIISRECAHKINITNKASGQTLGNDYVIAPLASLALGTGDIDCVYHFALYELIEAVRETGSEDSQEMLSTLINGRRLKDISDLPLDLAV